MPFTCLDSFQSKLAHMLLSQCHKLSGLTASGSSCFMFLGFGEFSDFSNGFKCASMCLVVTKIQNIYLFFPHTFFPLVLHFYETENHFHVNTFYISMYVHLNPGT